MSELNFLIIADTNDDLLPLRELLKTFEQNTANSIQLKRIAWERAWQTLLLDAIEGKGPHISQIGSTWSATMAMLDALRVFTEEEVATLGGADHFLSAAWETVKLERRPGIWAIPWSIYTFVLFYRQDLLEQAHIDSSKAFSTPETMRETFDKLSSKNSLPWAFPSLRAYADLVHIASSWVRANGGEFMSSDGRMPLFANSESSQGLVQFFELFPFIPSTLRGLSVEACTKAFARGQTALLVGGLEVGDDLFAEPDTLQDVRENLRVTTLPGVPWIGGDHLVIWKNARADLHVEKGALELVRFLSAKETQMRLFQLQSILPACLDAYPEINFSLTGTAETVRKVLEKGRPHPPIRLWRRIESFLDEMLVSIGKSVLEQPHGQIHEIVQLGLDKYAEKLATMLKG